MRDLHEIACRNQALWDRRAAQGDRNTVPFLDLDADAYRDYAAGRSASWPCMEFEEAPEGILLKQAYDRDVLCLASLSLHRMTMQKVMDSRLREHFESSLGLPVDSFPIDGVHVRVSPERVDSPGKRLRIHRIVVPVVSPPDYAPVFWDKWTPYKNDWRRNYPRVRFARVPSDKPWKPPATEISNQ